VRSEAKTVPPGLQMLGPALMVLGVMLPWGASPETGGLDRWGLMVLLVGIPALLLPWAARETAAAPWALAGLALIGAIGALGGWIAAWQAVPPEVSDPLSRVGKGPLFTLAGAVLTWATLPGLERAWHRALVAGGGFGFMLAVAMGISAGISTQRAASAAMGGMAPAPMGTPWIVIEVRPPLETPGTRPAQPGPGSPPSATPSPGALEGTSPAVGGPGPLAALPTATPMGEGRASPTPSSGGEGPGSSIPTPAPTATVPPLRSPLPSPTPPPSPLSP